MAAEFLKRGWSIVGTVRGGTTRTLLHDLADGYESRVEIEVRDINEPAQLASLREALAGRVFDMLFVNARVGAGPAPTPDLPALHLRGSFHRHA